MNYQEDVQQEAVDFISGHSDMIEEGFVNGSDWDRNDIDGLDEAFHESVTDTAYTVQDAAYIVSESDNVDDDSGLWEGQDPATALSTQAAYTFSADVWSACEEIYGELKTDFDERIVCQEAAGEEHEEDPEVVASEVVADWLDSLKVKPETDKTEQIQLIKKWLRMGEAAGGSWTGYPLGQSYIDARCGSGHGMPEVKEFVDFDHEIAELIPSLSGKYKQAVESILKGLEARERFESKERAGLLPAHLR